MDIELKGMKVDLKWLLDDISWARELHWEVTTEGPLELDHEHCLICSDIINRQDQEHKARSIEVTNTKWNDESGNLVILKSNHFLCWYCYERFIEDDGAEELRKLLDQARIDH